MPRPRMSELLCRACRQILPRDRFDPKHDQWGKPDGMHLRCRDCRSGPAKYQPKRCAECRLPFNPRSAYAKWCDDCRVAVAQCEVCASAFTVDRGHLADRRFCSLRCRGVTFVHLLNANRRPPKLYARPPARRGPDNNKWAPPVVLSCAHCGTTFERKPWELARGNGLRFCAFVCKTAYWKERVSGENSPHWVGGPKTSRGRGWKAVRRRVAIEQCGYCAHCNKYVGPSLPINHVQPFRDFQTAEEANRRENLLGLCQSCHMKAEPRPIFGVYHPRQRT